MKTFCVRPTGQQMINSWTAIAIQQWQSEGIELNEPISIENIVSAEKTINYVFPEQFKELYLLINGFKNNDWRVNMFSIWPIERIVEEYLDNQDKNFVGFSDYLINSHQIGFTKTGGGVFRYHEKAELISETFERAILLINEDSAAIYI